MACALIVVVTACGSQPDHVATFLPTLDKTSYKDCAQQRDQIARYLLTGEPNSLDSQYLDERTQVLRQPQGVQDAYVRQYVNQFVAQCDQTELSAIQDKLDAAQAAVDRLNYESSCLRLNGSLASADFSGLVGSVRDPHIAFTADTYKKGQCIVTYNVTEIGQSLTYVVPLATNGSMDSRQYTYNQNVRCSGHPEDFHEDTGVCLVVGFIS